MPRRDLVLLWSQVTLLDRSEDRSMLIVHGLALLLATPSHGAFSRLRRDYQAGVC